MATIGYARVSTDGQTLDAQIAALKAAGAERIYRETASGAKTERKELARALKSMTAGDTLLVTRLDRLARSTRDLLNILDAVAKAGAGVPFTGRRLGRYDHAAWPTDAHGSRRPRRV
jgi:DNA invertase Pin-like site-specific DNA recombinase